MPKHIISGIKYLAAIELRKKGLSHQEISDEIGVNRSTISHYLNGRNLSLESVEVAETILNLSPKDFLSMLDILFKDVDTIQTYVKIFGKNHFKSKVTDSCIGCGLCVDLCMMKSISLDSLKAQINPLYCCGCLVCVDGCPTNSIKILEV
ncbi:MAG: helix-turn-helix domain-containing protein [Clostridia bacterium]|nr:helix-turn-helix domain-containing protein [Clostridia bacterium]